MRWGEPSQITVSAVARKKAGLAARFLAKHFVAAEYSSSPARPCILALIGAAAIPDGSERCFVLLIVIGSDWLAHSR